MDKKIQFSGIVKTEGEGIEILLSRNEFKKLMGRDPLVEEKVSCNKNFYKIDFEKILNNNCKLNSELSINVKTIMS